MLSPKLLALFTEVVREDYGYGIGVENKEMGLTYSHGGSLGSYLNYLLYIKDYKLTVVMFTNVGLDERQYTDEERAEIEVESHRGHQAILKLINEAMSSASNVKHPPCACASASTPPHNHK